MSRGSSKLPELGPALKALRARTAKTQAEVAEAAGVNRGMVGEYERGAREPLPGTLASLLRAMGCDFADLEHALREVRGEESAPRRTNGDPAPDLEGLTRDAWATRHTQDLVSREVDRRVARIMRDILGHDPRALAGEDRQGEPARGQG